MNVWEVIVNDESKGTVEAFDAPMAVNRVCGFAAALFLREEGEGYFVGETDEDVVEVYRQGSV